MQFLSPEWLETVPSTNALLRERLGRGEALPSGYVLAARAQTAGRGRFQRRWVTVAGRDLAFSCVIRTAAPPNRLPSLPMAMALGVAAALGRYGLAATTKWPNDVLVDGRKLGGMLAELAPAVGGEGVAAVVGVGLNVNMTGAEAAAIDRPATSMFIETGRRFPPAEVLPVVLEAAAERIGRWAQGGFPALRDEWETRCDLRGKRIVVSEPPRRLEGIADGFGDDGELLLRDEAGEIVAAWSGDVA